MKKILTGALFLLVLIGANCAETSSLEEDCKEEPAEQPAAQASVQADAPVESPPLDETETPEPTHKIKLLMHGDFHGEDVEFKTGTSKKWLGLYRKKNKYFLLATTVKIKAVPDFMYAEDSGNRSGKRVSTNHKLPNVFLLKNAEMLRAGEVKTLFDGMETESDGINRKYRRQFELNGKKYTLAVEDATEDGAEYLTGKSKMIISSGNIKQTIYEQGGCDDCGWDLCWVGDLDKDGKPDFLLNLTNHYNVTNHRLFLSSPAEKGEIVREVAVFGTVGC
ncbi:MAG TPA: hypothetical protein VF721_04015 [Pyrinomonadaceae bacterium]|jgi:hypothetical protein